MGLDMNLSKETYTGNSIFEDYLNKYQVSVFQGENVCKTIKPKRVTEVIERVGYWRKANHIHDWFVQNVQDGVDNCAKYYVSVDSLKSLLGVCKMTLNNQNDAKTLLPRSEGFFFGSDEYDDDYFEDIKLTIEIIEPLLKELDESPEHSVDFYYQSSW